MNTTIAIAPMMDRTDRHFRYFVRLLNPDAVLYTEMVVAQAVLHGDRDRLLGYHPAEHPAGAAARRQRTRAAGRGGR